jgi:hypothetical protein
MSEGLGSEWDGYMTGQGEEWEEEEEEIPDGSVHVSVEDE